MKKFLTAVILGILTVVFASCAQEIQKNDSSSAAPEGIVMSEVAEEVTAELGERFNIPAVTATRGGKEVTVTVAVHDSRGEEVELQGRGTRFSVTDIEGYTMTYSAGEGEEKVEKTVTVLVADTCGPEIVLPASAENMTVTKGGTVSVPIASWEDYSGEVENLGCRVLFGGREIAVTKGENGNPDTFVAEEYGEYVITYTARDKFGNESVESVVVECARTLTLADFNDGSKVWAAEAYASFTTEHAVEGNALRLACDGGWQMIAVYPEYYDLSGFDKLQITVYADTDMDMSDSGFYLLNMRFPIVEGENIITVTKEELNSQYPGGRIPSTSKPDYYDALYLWFQVKSSSAAGAVWVDNLIGIFDNYTEDTAAPVIDLGNAAPLDQMTCAEGRTLTVPAAAAYDNSMAEDIPVSVTVTDKSGTDITAQVTAGNYVAVKDEAYQIVYTAKDAAGNTGTKTVSVEVTPKTQIPDIEKEEYFPQGRRYDVLQDFEQSGVDWSVVDYSFETEHVMNGESSVRLSTTAADCCVVLRLTKDGKRLETADWEKYEYIQAYVYADNETARFDFYGNMHPLNIGPNVVTITSAEILAEIAKGSNVYDSVGGFYFQLTTGTVYVDCIIGVYPDEGGVEPEVPEELKNYYPDGKAYDVLQDFESDTAIDTWFFPDSKKVTSKYALKGNSFQISGDADWAKLPIMMKKNGAVLTEEDWKAYESFRLVIYSKTDCQFAFLNKIYELKSGYNVVEISSAEILEQIKSNAECYTAAGYFWCQVTGNGVELYFDELIGIYPEGYKPEEEIPEALKNYYPEDKAYDVLQDFESDTAIDTWFFPDSKKVTSKYALKGNSFQISGDADWAKLPIMMKKNGAVLTEEDWKAYESFRLVIYSKTDCQFAFLNKIYELKSGYNVVEISSAEILEQIKSNAECYTAAGYFWCQVTGNGVELYFDELIGIYPADAAEEAGA